MSKWWLEEPWRLIQTNLREIDADLDPDRLVADVQELHGTVLLFNVGGIQANYPTELKYHFRNPHLRKDLVGEVLERTRAAGIRFLARFDFSKANEVYYAEHPEWFYRSLSGKPVNYNQQVHTCVNGYYQKEYSLEILREVLERYPIDGVFFNMFGYQTRDYSGNYHGICQCDNCKQAFAEFSGRALPTIEDHDDPTFRLYQRFQAKTVEDMLDRIADLVKSYGENIAVCTYGTYRIDIVRSESNSAVDRPLPDFFYSGSENTRFVTASWPDKTPSNSSVHFVDIPYRHVAVSEHLTQLRLAQTIAAGGGPDYYVISTLDRQNDRTTAVAVKELFDFHQQHEKLYGGMRPAAKVALMAYNRYSPEYQGLFRLLSEEHILFHNLDPDALSVRQNLLNNYEIVILPGPVYLDESAAAIFDAYVEAGGNLVVTQEVVDAEDDNSCRIPLASMPAERIAFRQDDMRGAYLELGDSEIFRNLGDLDLCWIDGRYRYLDERPGATRVMRLIPPCMYGPPEKCYYETIVDAPGLIFGSYGRGKTALIPWNLGALYNRHSWPGHRRLMMAVLEEAFSMKRYLLTDAPDTVEVTLLTPRGLWKESDSWLLQLVNASGHCGTAYFAPLPVRDIGVVIVTENRPQTVKVMSTGEALEFAWTGGKLNFSIPNLRLLEGVVIDW